MSGAALPPPFAAPRLMVTLNGVALDKPISATPTLVNNFEASRWQVAAGLSLDSTQTLQWWGAQRAALPLTVQILMGTLAPGAPEGTAAFQPVLTGRADLILADPRSGTVTLSGRDMLGVLYDTVTTQEFENQTSSEVVSLLAGQAGLNPIVTATTIPVGRYFDDSYTRASFSGHARWRTMGAICAELAEIEGFDLYADGNDLHFEDPSVAAANPFAIDWIAAQGGATASVPRIRPAFNLIFGRPIRVALSSYSARTGQTVIASGQNPGVGPPLLYAYTRPGFTADQANAWVKQRIGLLLRHAATLDVDLPAIPVPGLDPGIGRGAVALSGTGAWDGTYYVAQNEISGSVQGFTQRLKCQAVPDLSRVTVSSAVSAGTTAAPAGAYEPGASIPGSSPGTSPAAPSGNRNIPAGGWLNDPRAAPYSDLINANAATAGLTPTQFANQLGIESGFNPLINGPVLPSGEQAQGIAQILPSTAANPGYGMQPLPPGGAYDPAQAIPWAAQYTAARGGGAAGITAYSNGGYSLTDLGP